MTTALNLTTNPLHFSTVPPEGKTPQGELLGTGLLVAWMADRVGLPKKLSSTPHAKKLAAREMTGREFLIAACKSKLTTDDVPSGAVGKFLYGYTHRLFLGDDEGDTRDAVAKEIKKLLGLERVDEIAFSDDYLATFKKVVKNPWLVPDSWEAFDRFAPILDARWLDYQKTQFKKPPPKGIYAAAVKKRDKQKISAAATATKAGKPDALLFNAALTAELLGIVGKSLTDNAVKAVLNKVGLPIGKKIDTQANPMNGLAYLGAKFSVIGGGKERKLGVVDMQFYKKGQTRHIRGLGAEVEFAQYAGPLPKGITFDDDAKAVRKKVGVKPASSSEGYDRWILEKDSCKLIVGYTRKKVSSVKWSTLRDED